MPVPLIAVSVIVSITDRHLLVEIKSVLIPEPLQDLYAVAILNLVSCEDAKVEETLVCD